MNSELILFYNVENFFPPDKELKNHHSSGLYNWNPYKYNLKINRIKNVFRFIQEDYNSQPLIIGLAEIGALSVLEDLKKDNSPLSNHSVIYEKSQDSRGLSVAMLYDESKLKLVHFQPLNFNVDDQPENKTRDILHAEFIFNNEKLHAFVVHLPSKRLQDAKKNLRMHVINELQKVTAILSQKNEAVIIMGDFNENPDGEIIQQLLYNKDKHKVLTNPFEDLFKKNNYSTFHGKEGVLFDQIIFSDELLKDQFKFKNITAEIYNDSRLKNKDSKNSKYPTRTYSGSRYMNGYSDHFPVILRMKK